MSLQTSTLDKQPYFPLTQQIWHKAWHAEEGNSMQSLCAKIACIVFPIIFAVAIVEGILLAGRKVLQLFTKQKENNPQDNGVPPSTQPPIELDLEVDDSFGEAADLFPEKTTHQQLIELNAKMQKAIANKQKSDIATRQLMETSKKQSREKIDVAIAKLEKQRDALPEGTKERESFDRAITNLRRTHEHAYRYLEEIVSASGVA